MNYEESTTELADKGRVAGSGLYVDVENVEAIAKKLIESLMRNWPDDKAPTPCRLVLYVRADSAELWNAWATHEFTDISVVVRGVQHYVKTGSKNSSDIAIAVDAMGESSQYCELSACFSWWWSGRGRLEH